MSIEENRAIALRFADVWTPAGIDLVDELAAPDIVVSYPIPPEPIRGREAFKAFLRDLHTGLPDASIEADQVLAEGNMVACHWTLEGTHDGPLFGVPPTGRRVRTHGFTVYAIEDGLVVREYGMGDSMGLMGQIAGQSSNRTVPNAAGDR